MRHSAFTILTPVKDGAGTVGSLETLLNEIGDDIDGNPHLRFADLAGLHYASFSVVAQGTDDPYLVLEGNVDGPAPAFLHQLVHVAGTAVDRIYGHCTGYPEAGVQDPDAVLRYLADHDVGSDTFYVAWPGWSVDELRREQALRDRIDSLLDELDEDDPARRSPEQLRRWVVDRVRDDPELAWAAAAPATPFLVRHGGKVLVAAAAPLLAGLLAVVAAAIRSPAPRRARGTLLALAASAAVAGGALRAAEAGDDRRDAARDPDWQTAYARWTDHLGGIRHREDVQVQNHMISVTRIKAGWVRFTILRTVLWAIDAVARLTANKGRLGGIASIHFARWVITPDRRHLIFLSNFDGSWESYLSDFIDRAAFGLTAVWTNTDNDVGFPRTRWLVTGGARDEVRFKAYARSSMVPTNTWYSAYPTITVANMDNNMRIRRDLFASLDGDGTRAWLRRL